MGFDQCLMTCIHQDSIIQVVSCPKITLRSTWSSPLLQPLPATDLFTVARIFPFQECHTVGIIRAFSDCHLALSNIHLRYCVAPYVFLLLSNTPLYAFTTVCLYIHLLNDILVASNFWWSRRKPMCRFLCRYTFWNQDRDYWFDKARFNFERHCQNVFLSSCAIVHFHQLWTRVIFSLPPPQQSV